MVMIFVMILVGVFIFKTGHLSNEAAKQLSWIIVNITNPITLLCAALKDDNKISAKDLGISALCFAVVYALLILFGFLIPVILGVQKEKRYEYRMITIYGNVGFIGIPFTSAVLGVSALIYVAVCGLVFNVIMYTIGMSELRCVAEKQASDSGNWNTDKPVMKSGIRAMINTGTIMALVTLAVYLLNVQVPVGISKTLEYIGGCTTFMSMIVLGVSVAQMIPNKVFSNWRLYAFVVIRQIGVPVLIAYLLKPFGLPNLMLRTIVIMVAMPAANMPLMAAKQYGIEEDVISSGIIFTTLASILTIPIVIGLI